MQILTSTQDELLLRERTVLSDLQQALVQFGGNPGDQETIKKSILQIDDLFLLVVVGEFNSGKSSFINALLASKILKEGVTPTTTRINIIRHDDIYKETMLDKNTLLINAPVALLKEISIVDTPGTNAIIREHETITSQFIPRSDMVLFVTSSDRPLSESERSFLESIRDWGKKLVIVLNKIDLLQNDEEINQVTEFIRDNIRALLDIEPEIFPLSSREALLAKQGNPGLWQRSRFEALETHIQSTLDETGRIKLKFLNPLGVGLNLSKRYQEIIQNRLELLNEDVGMIENVDRQLAIHKEDMNRDFGYRMADIENILFAMESRGQAFFEENLRLARVPDLLNKNRIKNAFKDQVIADLPEQIEQKVNELIDWMVDRDFRQWKGVMDHLAERKQTHAEKIIGDPINASFNFDRNHLIETVARDARQVIESYDHQNEAQAIAEGAQSAVAAAAAVEVGAVGLGTLVTVIATTLTADVTGILVAGAIAVLGLFVIPARRRKANKELNEKISALRDQLVNSLRTRFDQEIKRSLERIETAITPYTRFVRAEKQNLISIQDNINTIQKDLLDIQNQIDKW